MKYVLVMIRNSLGQRCKPCRRPIVESLQTIDDSGKSYLVGMLLQCLP